MSRAACNEALRHLGCAQTYQANALIKSAQSEPPERAHALRQRAHLELLPPVLALLERRRLAGTLLPGKCAPHEIEWNRQMYAAVGATAAGDVHTTATYLGYQAYVKAAQVQLHATQYPAVFSQFTAVQTQQIFSCAETALDLISTSIDDPGSLSCEALMVHEARFAVQNHASVHVSGARLAALAAALGRLEASGVIKERGVDRAIEKVVQHGERVMAKVRADNEARGLLLCAHCGAREAHVAQFKRCSACKAVVFCCKDCQLANWPAHKAACKAARKAAADAAADT